VNNDFDLEDELKYPEGLYPVLELSDSILEFTEKLELIRGKLDDFEQRYLEADEELRECEGYKIPSSIKLERWQAAIEEMSDKPTAWRRAASPLGLRYALSF
jgi:uncharacterized coiled-coil DUF342 family protein